MLNLLWLGFFVSAFLAALVQWLFLGNADIFSALTQALFDMAELSFEIALGLTGILCLWMGLLRIAESSGLVAKLAGALSPLFSKLMPEVPQGHPALGHITMNFAANIMGLDNAATPMGIKAMHSLQELNPDKSTASNAQILFLVINTSSITLFPIAIFMYRAQQGAADPTSVFLPILLATCASTLVGILSVAYIQKLDLFNKIVGVYFGGFAIFIAAMLFLLFQLPKEELATTSSMVANLLLFSVIIFILVNAHRKKLVVYEEFIEGAKGGFQLAITILPYLVAMLVAIGVFRASGLLDGVLFIIREFVAVIGGDTRFVEALPTALMNPLSGSGARAMLIETMNTYGVDSFAARAAAAVQGSTETTFYVIAVYFGAVGVKRIRHTAGCGLLADAAGITTAIVVSYWFFG